MNKIILGHDDVIKLLPIEECIDLMDQAFR
jgi:hypothetical protein